jgi:hypothetical protein
MITHNYTDITNEKAYMTSRTGTKGVLTGRSSDPLTSVVLGSWNLHQSCLLTVTSQAVAFRLYVACSRVSLGKSGVEAHGQLARKLPIFRRKCW